MTIPEDVKAAAETAIADAKANITLEALQGASNYGALIHETYVDAIARAILTDREARSGWRDIASAPQDGTQIIGRTTPDEVFACRWFLDDDGEGDWLAYGTDVVRPREWMPDPSEAPQPEAYPVIPAGYKLVPVEPTPEMTEAGEDASIYHADDFIRNNADNVYRAMLAASPSPSREETETRDTAALLLEAEKALEPFAEHASEYDEESDHQQVWPTFEIGAFRAARSTLSKIRGDA